MFVPTSETVTLRKFSYRLIYVSPLPNIAIADIWGGHSVLNWITDSEMTTELKCQKMKIITFIKVGFIAGMLY